MDPSTDVSGRDFEVSQLKTLFTATRLNLEKKTWNYWILPANKYLKRQKYW